MNTVKKKVIKLLGNIKHFLRKSSQDNVSAIAGQSGFFIILSFVPFLMFAFAVLSFFGLPQHFFDSYIENVMPQDISGYIQQIISETYKSSVGIAFTTIVLALWSAGKGIYTITEGIRIIYKIPNRMNWFVKRLLAMGYTLVMFLAIVLSLGVLVVAQFFGNTIEPFLKELPYLISLLYGFRYVIMFVILVIMLAFALQLFLKGRVRDKRLAKFRLQLPGAILTALCWVGLSQFINIYVDYFNGFSIYGSLGTIAVVMVWLYFIMFVFLHSIELNYIYRFKIYKFSFKRLFNKRKK